MANVMVEAIVNAGMSCTGAVLHGTTIDAQPRRLGKAFFSQVLQEQVEAGISVGDILTQEEWNAYHHSDESPKTCPDCHSEQMMCCHKCPVLNVGTAW